MGLRDNWPHGWGWLLFAALLTLAVLALDYMRRDLKWDSEREAWKQRVKDRGYRHGAEFFYGSTESFEAWQTTFLASLLAARDRGESVTGAAVIRLPRSRP